MEGEGGEGGTTGNMICARANLSAHTTRASNNSTLRALAQTEAHLRSLKAECFDENYFRGIAGNIHIYAEFGVVVIKLRSTRGSNCSSRAELARLESCNYCLKC